MSDDYRFTQLVTNWLNMYIQFPSYLMFHYSTISVDDFLLKYSQRWSKSFGREIFSSEENRCLLDYYWWENRNDSVCKDKYYVYVEIYWFLQDIQRNFEWEYHQSQIQNNNVLQWRFVTFLNRLDWFVFDITDDYRISLEKDHSWKKILIFLLKIQTVEFDIV